MYCGILNYGKTHGIIEEEIGRRRLENMPFDHVFITRNGEELCHATGYEVLLNTDPNTWWNEYVDSEGMIHYGN